MVLFQDEVGAQTVGDAGLIYWSTLHREKQVDVSLEFQSHVSLSGSRN